MPTLSLSVLWRRLHRPAAWLLAAVFLVQGLLAVLVPWWLAGPAMALATQALKRPVGVDRARFNPFTWTVTLSGLRIGEAGALGGQDFVTVGQVVVDLSAASVLHLAPVLDAVRLESPRVMLVRTGPSRFNISDLLEPRPGTASGPPARFAVRDVSVHGGVVRLDDLTQDTHHAFEQIEFSLPGITSFQEAVDTEVTPLLTARVHGGTLRLAAQARPYAAHPQTTLHLTLQGVNLTSALAHMSPAASWRVGRGTLDSRVALTLREAVPQDAGAPLPAVAAGPGSAPAPSYRPPPAAPAPGTMVLSVQAEVDVHRLALSDAQGDPLGWETLKLGVDPLVLHLAPDGPRATLEGGRLALTGLRLADPAKGPALLALKSLQVAGLTLDSRSRAVQIGHIDLAGAALQARRDAQGALNLTQWLDRLLAQPASASPSAPAPATSASTPRGRQAPPPPPATVPPWSVDVIRATVSDTDAHWHDEAASPQVDIGFQELGGEFRGLSNRPGTLARYTVQTRLEHGGSLALDGSVKPDTLQSETRVQVTGVNLALAQPYLSQALNLHLSSGSLNTHGRLSVSPPVTGLPLRVAYRGEADITGLRAREAGTQEDFLGWKKLTASDLDIDLAPSAPSARDRIRIGGIALQDLDARLVVSPDGRINLQDVLKSPGTSASASASTSAPPSLPRRPTPTTPPSPVADDTSPTPGPRVQLGGLRIDGGRLHFTDLFIKPNYTANVTDLSGTVSATSVDGPPARLDLKGRVEGDAPVTIEGWINPVAKTLYADIGAKVRGIDLPMMSPYSAKYVGYAIERGKLSLDVHYRIDEGKLTADNRIFLDQLTFGEPVDSPTATRLPVLFAVALLKNSRGEIDLHLPVAGSLDDPQFSMGSVIAQAALNLLKRVVSSPFGALSSLISGSGHGGTGDDLGTADFVPGTDELTEPSKARLDQLAHGLIERPALRLDIAGHVDPVAELGPMRRTRLQACLEAERSRSEADRPAAPSHAAADDPARWLRQVYERTALPGKPRAGAGAAKAVPPADMESQLMAATPVTEDDMRQLAQARAVAARAALAAAQVPSDRMFLRPPVVSPVAPDAPSDKGVCRSACVGFELH